jgi:GT2 family glycosyltransferase
MCDADDEWEPTRLAEQVAFLAAHPDVAVVGSSIRFIDEKSEIRGIRSYPTDHAAIIAAMPVYNPLAQSSVTMRRGVVLAAGGYPDRADCICEDYELWSRLAHRGARFANLERPLVLYRLHRGAMKSRRLRATIRDTLWIKRTYWSDRPGLRARLRRWGERALLLLPTRLVHGLFVRTTFRRAREEGR